MATVDYSVHSEWKQVPHVDRYSDESVSELVRDLFGEGQRLVREEVRLAKSELREEIARSRRGAEEIAIGGVLAHTALLTLSAGIVLLLSLAMAPWVAAIIVAAALGGAGAWLVRSGTTSLRRVRTVPQTQQTLQENRAWARETMRAVKSKARERT